MVKIQQTLKLPIEAVSSIRKIKLIFGKPLFQNRQRKNDIVQKSVVINKKTLSVISFLFANFKEIFFFQSTMSSQENLNRQLEYYWKLYQEGAFSKGDIVAIFLVLYDSLFPTSNWLQFSTTRYHSDNDFQSYFFPKMDPDFKTHSFFKKVPYDYSMGAIFNQSLLKKETLRSCLGLLHVFHCPDTIQILDFLPTPMQVLEMQARGLRCVSLLRSANWFLHSFDHKRNIRDFVIHDLEHIWQMFEKPELQASQIEFSNRLFNLIHLGRFDFLLHDSIFSKEFNYIMSDMNTHPAHSYATLKSLITRQKKQSWLSDKNRPVLSLEIEISDIMQHFDSLVI